MGTSGRFRDGDMKNTNSPAVLRTIGPSTRAHSAVLKAAADLLGSKGGHASVTIEKIAARAKVAKTTVYRWWPSKIAIFMAVFEQLATKRLIGFADTGSLQGDLREVFRGLLRLFRTTSAGEAVAGMITEAQTNAAAAPIFREEFVARGRVLTRQALERGKKRGEVPEDLDADLVIDVISGAVWYRLLLGHAPLDDAYADGIVDIVVSGIRLDRDSLPKSQSAQKVIDCA
jgi:AcrR family transcriptional regulator